MLRNGDSSKFEVQKNCLNYDDLYSEDSKKVAAVARVLKTKHELFKKINNEAF